MPSPSGLRGFAAQHRSSVRVGIVGVVLLGIVAFLMLHTAGEAPVHQAPTITMVVIQPQKPPPPPPPLPQPKMIVQPKMTVPETKPMIPNQPHTAAPPKPSTSAAPPLGTSIHNNGPSDAFNLSGDTSGNGLVGGDGGGGGGSRWGWYQSVMQTLIGNALQKNRTTKTVDFQMQVRIWVDASGTITQSRIAVSSGNPRVDTAILNEVLPGVHLNPPPPPDMPMPIVTSLNQTAQ